MIKMCNLLLSNEEGLGARSLWRAEGFSAKEHQSSNSTVGLGGEGTLAPRLEAGLRRNDNILHG